MKVFDKSDKLSVQRLLRTEMTHQSTVITMAIFALAARSRRGVELLAN